MESEKQKKSISASSASTEKIAQSSREQSNPSEKPPAVMKKPNVYRRVRKRGAKERSAQPSPTEQLTSTPASQIDPTLHKNMIDLHDRAKILRSKLNKMKETMNTAQTVSSFEQNCQGLTEDAIRKEIERLHLLMEELRLKGATQQRIEKQISVGSDAEPRDATNKRSVPKAKGKRDRKRYQKSEKVVDEKQLQVLYETHINQIVSGTNTDDPKYKDLQFKIGDDLEEFAQKCVDAGLGNIIEAEVRVNAKNNHQAFLTLVGDTDAMITSMAARKYALDGDIVRAFVRNSSGAAKIDIDEGESSVEVIDAIEASLEDPEEVVINDVVMLKESEAISPQRNRAFVIRIIKQTDNRVFVGSISFKNPVKLEEVDFFKFQPHDMKVPMIYIPVISCKDEADAVRLQQSLRYLFLAEITEIKEKGRCIGKLKEPVGTCGNIEDEIKAILLHNGLKDIRPFEERFENMWTTTKTDLDLHGREDLRNECIFTIDPLTARDLDDAVSCRPLENGQYEFGVHISDVSYFLEENSELDELVKNRATSIYLVNEVIHMLPKTLCFKCSLLPDEDKYAFSVFWIMNEKAEIISTRFARTVIRSCTQLAYEHAQKILDNPTENFSVDDFPTICNGFQVTDILDRVRKLNEFAVIMRNKRFENGSLSIDKPQLSFQLDPKTGEPIAFDVGDRKEANFLIEEFMLLANQSVAQFIYKRFPEISFLRRHEPPKPSALTKLKIKLSESGINLDLSSSKSIYKGLQGICGTSVTPQAMAAAMNYLLTKPMMRAKYVCSEGLVNADDLYHYALAIPIYTHFTSPIRRYPDVLVHRVLAAALDLTPPPKRNVEELHDLARICNEQKLNAKNAGEDSANLFFKRYVNVKKYVKMQAVVIAIYRHSIEVITLETGHLITIQFKLQKTIVDASKSPHAIGLSEKNSTKPPVKIEMFSAIFIKLMMIDGKLTGFFYSPDPEQRIANMTKASQGSDAGSRKKTRKVRNSEGNDQQSTSEVVSKSDDGNSEHVNNVPKSKDTRKSTKATPLNVMKAENVKESKNKIARRVPKLADNKHSKTEKIKESTKKTAAQVPISVDTTKSKTKATSEAPKSEPIDNLPKSKDTEKSTTSTSPEVTEEENIEVAMQKISPVESKLDDIEDSIKKISLEVPKTEDIEDPAKQTTSQLPISEDTSKSKVKTTSEAPKSEHVDNIPKSKDTEKSTTPTSKEVTEEENIEVAIQKISPVAPKLDDIEGSIKKISLEVPKTENIEDPAKQTTSQLPISEDTSKSKKKTTSEAPKSEQVDKLPKSKDTDKSITPNSPEVTEEENIEVAIQKISPVESKLDDIEDSIKKISLEVPKTENIEDPAKQTTYQLPKSEDTSKPKVKTTSEAPKSEHVDNIPKSKDTEKSTTPTSKEVTEEENIEVAIQKISPVAPKLDDIEDSIKKISLEVPKTENIEDPAKQTTSQLPISEDTSKSKKKTTSEAPKSEHVGILPKSKDTDKSTTPTSPEAREEENIEVAIQKISPVESKLDHIEDSIKKISLEVPKTENIEDPAKQTTSQLPISEDTSKSKVKTTSEAPKSEYVDRVPNSMDADEPTNASSPEVMEEENIEVPKNNISPVEPKLEDTNDCSKKISPEVPTTENIQDPKQTIAQLPISENSAKSEKESGSEVAQSEHVK